MKYFIVHYNTPELTTALCSSVIKNDNDAEIYIFENSDKRKFENVFQNVKVLDNSKHEIIEYEKIYDDAAKYFTQWEKDIHYGRKTWGTLQHTRAVQWFIDTFNEEFILLDSDVLVKKPLNDIIDNSKCASCELYFKDGKLVRALPFLIYFNPKKLKEIGLNFFDISRINACKIEHDTGGSFGIDILKNNIDYKHINVTDYVVHFGNGSFRGNNLTANLPNTEYGTYKDFLMRYKNLWK